MCCLILPCIADKCYVKFAILSFQDSKKYPKKRKVAWLVMSSAMLLQVMIWWMIWWVLDYIDYGRIGKTLKKCKIDFILCLKSIALCLHIVAYCLANISDWYPNWIHFLEWSILMWLVGQVSIPCAMINLRLPMSSSSNSTSSFHNNGTGLRSWVQDPLCRRMTYQ